MREVKKNTVRIQCHRGLSTEPLVLAARCGASKPAPTSELRERAALLAFDSILLD